MGRKGNIACLEREAGQVWEVWQHREQGCIRAVAHLLRGEGKQAGGPREARGQDQENAVRV